MTCKITRPLPKDLFNRTRDMFSTTVLGGGNIIPESNEWYVVSLDYALQEEFYSLSEQQWRERDPRYACCENLVALAELDGYYPSPKTFAQGYLRITGTPGANLQQDITIQFGNQQYAPASTLPVEIPNSGEVIFRAVAIQPGPDANIPATATGVLSTPLPGVNQTVTLYGGRFCGGAEAETCEQFRTRYLDRMKYKRKYGVDWIKEKILEWPCVTSVCERGGACCTVDLANYGKKVDCNKEIQLYAIFDGTFPCGLAPQCVVDEITAWVFGEVQGIGQGEAEWGMIGRVFTATATYVNITVDGLACASPSQAGEIESRISDFISRICPSETLRIEDLKVIISQLMGSTQQYDVIINSVIPDDPNLLIDVCGDAEPACDYKICLNQVIFANPTAVNTGVCL